MLRKLNLGVVVLLSVIMYSCYPKGADTINDTNLVYTNYDDTFDFKSEKTYYLVPDVIYVDTTATENNQVNQAILSSVRSQFNAFGWTELDTITDPSEVNMVVMTSILTVDINTVTYWPGYGGWYGGWWGGWGYPGYGGYYPVYTSYSIGSIFIDGFDGQTLDPDSDTMPPLVWSAILNGVLGSQISSGTVSRVESLIDQAFVQSPYLN
jgi:hypothetical protein